MCIARDHTCLNTWGIMHFRFDFEQVSGKSRRDKSALRPPRSNIVYCFWYFFNQEGDYCPVKVTENLPRKDYLICVDTHSKLMGFIFILKPLSSSSYKFLFIILLFLHPAIYLNFQNISSHVNTYLISFDHVCQI